MLISEPWQWTGEQLTGTGVIATLEAQLKSHYHKKYALCVSNATLGLWAIALALGLHQMEFITPAYSYGATLAGWLLQGHRPSFAPVNPITFTLDPEAVRGLITPRTKAIVSVDLFGTPAPMAPLKAIAEEYGLWLISDGAQSLGAWDHGQPASSAADALVISFTVGKTLNCGEGGAILTDHDHLYEKLVWWTQHPERQRRELGLNLTNEFGLNGRIHPLAAAIASQQFSSAMEQCRCRQQQYLRLIEQLTAEGLIVPLPFREQGLLPSFFRCGVPLAQGVILKDLQQFLAHHDPIIRVEPLLLMPLYHHPAFLAQWGDRFTSLVPPVELDSDRYGILRI